jgi:hypothetical protein
MQVLPPALLAADCYVIRELRVLLTVITVTILRSKEVVQLT